MNAINLQRERTRRSIGRQVVYCPYCKKVVSFAENKPFCRNKKCNLFNRAFDGAEYAHSSVTEVALERR